MNYAFECYVSIVLHPCSLLLPTFRCCCYCGHLADSSYDLQMLLVTYTLLAMLVTTTRLEMASASAESVMERPVKARPLETTGEEEHDVVGGVSLSSRQGVPGGMTDIISITLNALNSVPYLMGDINGMHQVTSSFPEHEFQIH